MEYLIWCEYVHIAHKNIMLAGKPSVLLVRQFVHACGIN